MQHCYTVSHYCALCALRLDIGYGKPAAGDAARDQTRGMPRFILVLGGMSRYAGEELIMSNSDLRSKGLFTDLCRWAQ